MIDDPLEWLAVSLDDDEPTIPDALGDGWISLVTQDEVTRPIRALDEDEPPPDAEWELEVESMFRTRPLPRAS